MRFVPSAVKSDPARAPFFDGSHEEEAELMITCPGCGAQISLRALSFLGQARSWVRSISEEDRIAIAEHFGCRRTEYLGVPIFEGHGEGQPYFGLTECAACATRALIYFKFYEMQPARYIGKLQGVAAVAP